MGQILKLRRSADDKVFMVVRVPRRDDIEVKNLWQHVGERARDSVRTWRRMQNQMVAVLLGFSRYFLFGGLSKTLNLLQSIYLNNLIYKNRFIFLMRI